MRPVGEGIGGGWSLRAGLGLYGLPAARACSPAAPGTRAVVARQTAESPPGVLPRSPSAGSCRVQPAPARRKTQKTGRPGPGERAVGQRL